MSICNNLLSAAFLFSLFVDYGVSTATLSSSQSIKDSESLISPDNTFKLGFFSPVNSTNRYVGIWYNQIPVITPIWIANRNNLLTDSSGILKVSENGNLLVLNGQDSQNTVWSSNVSSGNSTAQLNNDGNLILFDSINGNIKWESFQEPLNILARHMRLTFDGRTGEKGVLRSWKSNSDPSIGSFSLEIDPSPIPQALILNGSSPYWRSGPWNGQIFIGIPFMNAVYLDGFTLVPADKNGVLTFSFNYVNESSLYNYVLSSEGEFSQRNWINESKSWEVIDWFTPQTQCDVYGTCGLFGVCDPQDSPICSCLRGFEPKNTFEWGKGNWSDGCARRSPLQCGMINNGSEVRKTDGFLKLEKVKVPDFAHWSTSPEVECEEDCLNNCSCVAYSYYDDFGCLTWSRDLIDTQKFSRGGGDLHFRVAYLELDNKRSNMKLKVIISVTVLAGVLFILVCALFLWKMAKLKERKRKRMKILFSRKKKNQSSIADVNRLIDNQVKLQELPVFDLQMLTTATDNFDISNKLGQGGFGPVYKGKLFDGQYVAVKRLSRASGQGLEEFVNEVVLISKLQHRNLVRIFGCCVEGEEKMLVYEYMPNKSLDAFLFDPTRKQLLAWRKRFHIVEGICRGLLYLHRDSRLRIIHRDLKPSNILLDHELNPKISDFGMARIFGGNEDQGATKRVVGTYGYMSPEYAMEGRFSEKSDVFSLGVLLLEITSGRRNTSFYESDEGLSLLGYAWKLWNENNIRDLVDEVLSESDPSSKAEILRCIHVGLLCVQEFAKDRPNSSTVLSMLTSEIVDLPTPKQPAFSAAQIGLQSDASRKYSDNLVTVSVVDGR
ncbi:G-type lectin S-receptor-like serine/threonine-protein kinase At1g11330 [Euphorbia peplus]|nr:G-type lectin S-receptor-like serine/threonine-protein kinase At1g11330 [Euphorbia peplus]